MKTKSDRAIKMEATKKEYYRVYDQMCLPPQDIEVECSDGRWIRKAWHFLSSFGWDNWTKLGGK